PKSESTINIYQIFGFQEAEEGYKIVYIDNNNEPAFLYLPIELLDQVHIYSTQGNTYNQNFLIIWQKADTITRVDWYQPRDIDYTLPNNLLRNYTEKDREIFKTIADNGKIILGSDMAGAEPTIRAPGGGE
ncbi:MAG: hypothetical protein KAJ15_11405, partial [Spirochaetes bacterium]|nr:hypothetical protein [Spirochaetota bacterium]